MPFIFRCRGHPREIARNLVAKHKLEKIITFLPGAWDILYMSHLQIPEGVNIVYTSASLPPAPILKTFILALCNPTTSVLLCCEAEVKNVSYERIIYEWLLSFLFTLILKIQVREYLEGEFGRHFAKNKGKNARDVPFCHANFEVTLELSQDDTKEVATRLKSFSFQS